MNSILYLSAGFMPITALGESWVLRPEHRTPAPQVRDAALLVRKRPGCQKRREQARRHAGAPDGRWFCFEVNPSPGFSFCEEATGQPIGAAIADLLIANHTSDRRST